MKFKLLNNLVAIMQKKIKLDEIASFANRPPAPHELTYDHFTLRHGTATAKKVFHFLFIEFLPAVKEHGHAKV